MPIETKYYTCAFKCGRNARASKDAVSKHEGICWHNPKMRTCRTCIHGEHEPKGYSEFEGSTGGYWTCKSHETASAHLSKHYEALQGFPMVHCPFWDGGNGSFYDWDLMAENDKFLLWAQAHHQPPDLPF